MFVVGASSLALPAQQASAANWKIKKAEFSAISIGVAFESDTVGWSFFTDGSSAVKTVRTLNGGKNFTAVSSGVSMGMPMGCTGIVGKPVVATTGILADTYSSDGETFNKSSKAPFESQSIQMTPDGRTISVDSDAVSLSTDSGKTFKMSTTIGSASVGGARYAAWPSKDVIFVTAGQWPSSSISTSAGTTHHQLTSKIAVTNTVSDSFNMQRMHYPSPMAVGNTTSGYAAGLFKSSDGGVSWKQLLNSVGSFYFNGIDCFDATTCVAVGEGFGQDGSTSPGARAYLTTDGETFNPVFHDTTDGSSLMASKMFSKTSYQIGGRGAAYVAQSSTDGGKTHTPLGTQIKGQMITAFGFVSETHGYATTVNQLQISSLLEFGDAPSAL